MRAHTRKRARARINCQIYHKLTFDRSSENDDIVVISAKRSYILKTIIKEKG